MGMNVLADGQQITNRELWKARAVWAVIAAVAVGFLATSTPGSALDVPARPLLSLIVFSGVAGAYVALVRTFSTNE